MRRAPIRTFLYFALVSLFGFSWAACGKATDQEVVAVPAEDGAQKTTQNTSLGAEGVEDATEEKENPMVEPKLLNFTRKAFFNSKLDSSGKEYAYVVGVFKKVIQSDPATLPLKDFAFNGQFVKYVTRVVPSLRHAGFSLARDNLEIQQMMMAFARYNALPPDEPENPKKLQQLEARRLINIFAINADGLETAENTIDLEGFSKRFNLELARRLFSFAANLSLFKDGILDYWHVFAANSIASVDLGDEALLEMGKKFIDSFPANSGLDVNAQDAVRLVFAVGALKETSKNQYFGIFDFSTGTLSGFNGSSNQNPVDSKLDLEDLADVSASQKVPNSIREQYYFGNLGFSSLFIDSFGFYPLADTRYFPPPRGDMHPKTEGTFLDGRDSIKIQAE